MVQPRCARLGAGLLLAGFFLADPATVYSQGSKGNTGSSIVGEIKGLVDIVFQAMQQGAPNREMKHLNQAIHQLLLALEGSFSHGHHHKKHHKHHHHGQGLGGVGSKGRTSGSGASVAQFGTSAGKQGSRFLNQGGSIFLSPGSRLTVVQAEPASGAGAFARMRQTAKTSLGRSDAVHTKSRSKSSTNPSPVTTTSLSTTNAKHAANVGIAKSGKKGSGAFGSGVKQTGQACLANAATKPTCVTTGSSRGIGGMPVGGLVNIRGNNNTVNINLNVGTKQSPSASTGTARVKGASVAPKQVTKSNVISGSGKPVATNQKPKVAPKSSFVSSNTANNGKDRQPAGAAKTAIHGVQQATTGRAKSATTGNHANTAGAKTTGANQFAKAKTGGGNGMKLAAGKTSSARNQGVSKGRTSAASARVGAAGHRAGNHASAQAKTSGSQKKGR